MDSKPKREQSAYRKIVRKTWRKTKFRALTPELKLFLFYLWTCPDAITPGIYYIGPGTIADDLDTDTVTVLERLRNGMRNGWFKYDETARIIFFPKWADYDPPPNANTVISYIRHVLDLPESQLRYEFAKTLEPYIQRYSVPLPNGWGTVAEPYIKPFPPPSPFPIPSHKDTIVDTLPETGQSAREKNQKQIEEEIRKKTLELMLPYLNHDHIPYMPSSEPEKYKIAGWLVKKCLGRPEVALEFLHQQCKYLAGLKDMTVFRKVVTTICKDPETMGDIESAAYRENRTEYKQSEPSHIKDALDAIVPKKV